MLDSPTARYDLRSFFRAIGHPRRGQGLQGQPAERTESAVDVELVETGRAQVDRISSGSDGCPVDRYSCCVRLRDARFHSWTHGLIRPETFDPAQLDALAARALVERQSVHSGDGRWDRHLHSVATTEKVLPLRPPTCSNCERQGLPASAHQPRPRTVHTHDDDHRTSRHRARARAPAGHHLPASEPGHLGVNPGSQTGIRAASWRRAGTATRRRSRHRRGRTCPASRGHRAGSGRRRPHGPRCSSRRPRRRRPGC